MRRIDETFLESPMFPIRLLAADDNAVVEQGDFYYVI